MSKETTGPEKLPPHEMARRLVESPKGVPVERKIGELLRAGGAVWQQLKEGEFSPDEHGFVKFIILGSNEIGAGDSIDGIRVEYHPVGEITTVILGGIHNYPQNEAYAKMPDGSSKKLSPDMPEWDPVVGTIQRAITECQKKNQE